jgi:vacuolar-type H+-ATPase subunit D/Vma8
MTENELIALKQEIDEAKEQHSKLQGQREALFQQLKDEYGCSTIKQAEKLLSKMDEEITSLSNEISIGLQEIEDKFYDNDK